MVNKCPANFYDQEIVSDCQTTNETELLMDFRLSIPVTTIQNVTYRNVFCAYCNGERHYEFWRGYLLYTRRSRTESNMTWNSISVDSMLSNLTIDERHSNLISNLNGTIFECYIYGEALDHFKLHPCSDECSRSKFPNDAELDGDLPVNQHDLLLPRSIKYSIERSYIDNGKIFFHFIKSRQNSLQQEESCFPAVDKEVCVFTDYRIVKDDDFRFIDDKTVLVNEKNVSFGPSQWCNTFVKDVIFVCVTASRDIDYSIASILLLIVKTISGIFSLLLIITLSADTKKRQSLPNRLIVSYSVTLLAQHVTTSASYWLSSCKIIGPFMHYFRLSRCAWLSVLAYDFWRMIHRSSILHKNIPHSKRFSIYCLIGWISPLSILSVSLFLELAINDVPCNLRPAYGRLMFCHLTQEGAIRYFDDFPALLTSCIIIILFLHSSYYVYQFSKLESIKSSSKINNMEILVKLALTMSLAFTTTLISVFFNNPFAIITLQVFDHLQNILMYFVHGYDRKSINSLCRKYITRKKNSTTRYCTNPTTPSTTTSPANSNLREEYSLNSLNNRCDELVLDKSD